MASDNTSRTEKAAELTRKGVGILELITAFLPFLPRFVRGPVRSASRTVRRTDRQLRRVNRAYDKLKG